MSHAYTTFWSRERVEAATRHAGENFRFEMLFGGPHVSLPSFRRAGVTPGDTVYPIAVCAGAMRVLGRMRVARVVSVEEFRAIETERAAKVGPFDLAVRLEPPPQDAPGLWNTFLAPTCVNEVLLGAGGTSLLMNVTVPPDTLRAFRFTSRRGERAIKHLDADGRITSIVSLQGVFRLSDESAHRLAMIIERAAPSTTVK